MLSLLIKKKENSLRALHPGNGEATTGFGVGGSLGAGSIQPGMAPRACPGAWRSAPPPLAATPLPRNPPRRGSLTECVRERGSAIPRVAAGRRAEPQPTPGQRVARQSPRWRSGATANGEPHAPRSARPAPPARPPASAQRSAAPSARPSEPPRRRRLPGHPGLAWPLRLLRAAQPHPFPPSVLGAARK